MTDLNEIAGPHLPYQWATIYEDTSMDEGCSKYDGNHTQDRPNHPRYLKVVVH